MIATRKSAKLTDTDHKWLKLRAAETGRSVEALLGEAVELLRRKHAKRAKPAQP